MSPHPGDDQRPAIAVAFCVVVLLALLFVELAHVHLGLAGG